VIARPTTTVVQTGRQGGEERGCRRRDACDAGARCCQYAVLAVSAAAGGGLSGAAGSACRAVVAPRSPYPNGPALTSLRAVCGSVGPSPNDGQSRATPHAPHAGLRA
jgi:hypothetical protein